MRRWLFIFVVVLSGLAVSGLSSVRAAESTTGDIQLSPALIDLTLADGAADARYELELTNHAARTVTLLLSPVDVTGQTNLVQAAFPGTTTVNFDEQYGLSDWVTLAKETVILEPGETESVTVRVTNQVSLSPGGHYGVVRVTESLPRTAGGEPTVAVQPTLTSLLLVKKVGGERAELALAGIQAPQRWLGVPARALLRFHNSGNVHVIPRGRVTVLDAFGRSVAEGVVNVDSGIVLPESFRTLTVPLVRTGVLLTPGQYQVKVAYRMDQVEDFQTASLALTIVPRLPLEIVLLLLLSGLLWWLKRSGQSRARRRVLGLVLGGVVGSLLVVGQPVSAAGQPETRSESGTVSVTARVGPSVRTRAGLSLCSHFQVDQTVLTVGDRALVTGTLCDHREQAVAGHQVVVVVTSAALRQVIATQSDQVGAVSVAVTAVASAVGEASIAVWDTTVLPPVHLETLHVTVVAAPSSSPDRLQDLALERTVQSLDRALTPESTVLLNPTIPLPILMLDGDDDSGAATIERSHGWQARAGPADKSRS